MSNVYVSRIDDMTLKLTVGSTKCQTNIPNTYVYLFTSIISSTQPFPCLRIEIKHMCPCFIAE